MTRMVLSRCVLRPLRADDAASIARHANNRAVWRNLTDRFPHPYGVEEGRRWIASIASDDPACNFGIEVDGEVVGGIGVERGEGVERRSLAIGYWLGESYWGRGIATEAVMAVTAYAFETFDVNRISAGVYAWNPASARVLEKAGYLFEGRLRNAITKDGETTDELIYATVR